MHNVGVATDTAVGLSSVEQVFGLEPRNSGRGVGGKHASAHWASALVLGNQVCRHAHRGRNARQTVQVRTLVGHGGFVGDFSSGHFICFGVGYTLLSENNLFIFIHA